MAYSKPSHPASQYQTLLDNELLRISRNLVPAEVDLRDAKEVANKIFRTLQKNRRFKIDRVGIMGSVEKKTALACEFDLDCVVFINDISIRDFPQVFTYFEQTLELEQSLSGIVYQKPKTKGAALQATVDGFEFDIVPAINFSEDPVIQRESVLQKISLLDHPSRDGYRFSSSLIQDQVDFIKKQSPFVHDVIRLAKFWNRSIFIDEYISGRSTTIELIAVDAANKVEQWYHERSLSKAFKQFLEYMKNLKRLRITFDQPGIEDYILRQRPLVIDPSNPYNNFAYDLSRKDKVREKFEQFANITYQRLISGNQIGLLHLFTFQLPPVAFSTRHDHSWIVEVCDNTEGSKRVRIIERNVEGNHSVVKILKHFFSFNVKFVDSDGKTKEQLQTEVKKSINEMEGREFLWTNRDGSHSDRDITYEIPSGDKLIRCSCNI